MNIAATSRLVGCWGVAALILAVTVALFTVPASGQAQPNDPRPPGVSGQQTRPTTSTVSAPGTERAILAAQQAIVTAVGQSNDRLDKLETRLETIEDQGDAHTDLLLVVGSFVCAAVFIRWFRQSSGLL